MRQTTIFASICVAVLVISLFSVFVPKMSIPSVKAQLADNWLVASDQQVFGYSGSGTSFNNLTVPVTNGFNMTDWMGRTHFVPAALTITSVASGNGYYLVGLEQHSTSHWPQYTNPVESPHLYKYDGDSWSPVGDGALDTVQITSITKYLNEFIIVGWYMSFGWGAEDGRVYSYDGSTLTDITTSVLGGYGGNLIYSVANCGNYVLFGEHDWSTYYNSQLVLWNGTDASVVSEFSPGSVPTSIAYNGQYALFGSNYDTYLNQFFDNGTVNSLSWSGSVSSIGWNGTHFLISGNDGTKLFDGSQFTTVDAGNYGNIGWNGAFWLLGSGTKLAKLQGSTFSTISSDVGWSIVALCPNIMQLLVTSDPDSVSFQALGGNMKTPVSFPMSLGGNVHFVVPDNFTNNAPTGKYYNFDHAIYSHDGINETIPDPVAFDVTVGSDSNVTLFYNLETLPVQHHGGGTVDQLNATYTVDVMVLANKTEAYGAMVLFGQQSASTDYIGYCSFRNIQAGTYHLTITYYDPITSQNLRYDNDITVNKDMQITVDLLLQTLIPKTTFYFPWWLILLLIIIAMIVVYVAYRIRSRNSHRSSGRRRRR